MDITLDIGKNVVESIDSLAKEEQKQFDIMALELLDLGLRVHLSSKKSEDSNVSDPILSTLLHKVAANQFMLKEILSHVFIKERSFLKTYDALTAISVTQHMADAFMDREKNL